MPRPIITLLTDFGDKDGFVAQMKGVILTICPEANLVDLCHAVPMNHVARGMLLLRDCYPCFPKGTIHVAVVDPEVGLPDRRPIVVKAQDHLFVGPDNGLFGFLHDLQQVQEVREILNDRLTLSPPARTFHGRDVFAPVAAHLALGTPLEEVGPVVTKLKKLKEPRVVHTGLSVRGQVMYLDHFGNLVTNITFADFGRLKSRAPHGRDLFAEFHGQYLPIRAAFGEVEQDAPLAYWGSRQTLEIGVNRGSAADRFKSGSGDAVALVVL